MRRTLYLLALGLVALIRAEIAHAAEGPLTGLGPFKFGMSRDAVSDAVKGQLNTQVKREGDSMLVAGPPFPVEGVPFTHGLFSFSEGKLDSIFVQRRSEMSHTLCLQYYSLLLARVSARYGKPDHSVNPTALPEKGEIFAQANHSFKNGGQIVTQMHQVSGRCDLSLQLWEAYPKSSPPFFRL